MKKKINQKLMFYLPLFIIMTMSLLVMYQSVTVNKMFEHHFLKQSMWFFIGILILCFKNKLNLKWIYHQSFIFYFINVILLILVLFFGTNFNNARAWFRIGGISFQPSECMKLFLCLYLAKFTSKQVFPTYKSEFCYLIKVFLLVLIPSILVFLEPDTGAILFYMIIALFIIMTSKIHKRWIFTIFILFGLLLSGFFFLYYQNQDILINLFGTSFFYRVERILNFQKGLQIENALVSIGSAPFFRFNLFTNPIYIPEAPTDFAFAQLANVLGIAGMMLALLCYFAIDLFFIKKWQKTKNIMQKYFLSGFIGMFFINQFQNILMNIGLMPIMGIPLPFLSYGGTSTIIMFIFLAIILTEKKVKT